MKLSSYLILAILFLLSVQLKAQAPNEFNYQGVARNSLGAVLPNQTIGLEFTIHQDSPTGTIVYQETQTDSTDQFGLFSTAIGTGTVKSGTFTSISWGNNTEYLQVGMDPNGGTNYTDMGTQQFLSVPYALYAASSGTPNAWQLNGNPVTYTFASAPSTYLGTTASGGAGFQFGVGGSNAGRIEATDQNTAIGYESLNSTTTAIDNTAIGFKAIYSDKMQIGNIAVGDSALYTQNYGTAFNSNNVAVGNSALFNNNPNSSNSAYQNTAIGNWSMKKNTTGSQNTALGYKALYSNITGTENTAIGYNAGLAATTLTNATVIGANAIAPASNSVTLGSNVTSSFYLPGYSKVNSVLYTAAASGLVASTGTGTSGQVLTLNGSGVPTWATISGTSSSGWQLTGNSYTYTFGSAPATYLGTTTSGGTGFQFGVGGKNAGRVESTNQNTALGYLSMNSNNTATNTAAKNTAIGFSALYSNTAQSGNIAIGDSALYTQYYGTAFNSNNVAVGNSALFLNNPSSSTNGYQNTAIGDYSLKTNTNGYDNTAIGYHADVASNNLSYATAIGAGAKAGESNSLILGGASGTSSAVNVGIGTSTPSSTLQLSGGNLSLPIITSAASVDLSTSPLTYTVIITATGQTVTLPTVSTCTGRVYLILAQMASGSVTTSSFLNFNGVTTTSIPAGNSIIIQSDGTNWDQIK